MRRVASFFLYFSAISSCFAATPSGIPREFARERAQLVSDLHYKLRFTLEKHATSTAGREELSFQLKSATQLWIDYREGKINRLRINGTDTHVQAENGHILLPQQDLRVGVNNVSIDFESPIAPAGKAITRYEDKDDGSEYIYTLFVPMDASMAFPCFDQPDLKGRFTLGLDLPTNWEAISNTAAESHAMEIVDFAGKPGMKHLLIDFGETQPISTYLFAFCRRPVSQSA